MKESVSSIKLNESISELDLPSPETKEPGVKRKRRRLTVEFKLRLLKEADSCSGSPGALGELLRREGVYAVSLTLWRKLRAEGRLVAVKRGRKSALNNSSEVSKNEYDILKLKYRQALLIIEAQKKIAEILNLSVTEPVQNGRP